MKTIEERAMQASEGYDDQAYSAGIYTGYKEGATEQRKIDIDKACEWLKISTECVVYPCSVDSFIEDFRKVMEKD